MVKLENYNENVFRHIWGHHAIGSRYLVRLRFDSGERTPRRIYGEDSVGTLTNGVPIVLPSCFPHAGWIQAQPERIFAVWTSPLNRAYRSGMRLLCAAIIVAGLCCLTARAEDWTVNGKTYHNVTVTKVEPDAVHIMFDGGIGSVKIADLTPELQKKFNYDPAKAKAAEKAEADREAQSDRERALAAQKQAKAKNSGNEDSAQTNPNKRLMGPLADRMKMMQDTLSFDQRQLDTYEANYLADASTMTASAQKRYKEMIERQKEGIAKDKDEIDRLQRTINSLQSSTSTPYSASKSSAGSINDDPLKSFP